MIVNQLNEFLISCFILLVALNLNSCSSEDSSNNALLSCGDLLSIYAQKAEKLEFLECSKIENSQVQLEAKYFVSSENANEVMEFLIENYKLKSPCDYYFSMGMDIAYLQPENLLDIDPYYVLHINVRHKDFEKLITQDCEARKNTEFFVYVQVLLV